MPMPTSSSSRARLRDAHGYSMIELMVAIAVLTVISGSMLDGVFKITRVSGTVNNRSEMHSAVRNATELLQQEIGQAGRVALPDADASTIAYDETLATTAVAAAGSATVTLNAIAGIFQGEKLVFDTGANEETIVVSSVNTGNKQITATFVNAHAANVPVHAYGGFAAGVVPPSPGFTNGSTGTLLKVFGDINDTGRMVYIEYWCDTSGGNLYRRSMDYAAGSKPALTPDLALLNHIQPNPDGTPCFTYDTSSANNVTYVVNVAITLTVETAQKDPQTGLFQRETKALLNVAPRNVFNVWQMAGLGIQNRIQPMPPSVTTLLAAQ